MGGSGSKATVVQVGAGQADGGGGGGGGGGFSGVAPADSWQAPQKQKAQRLVLEEPAGESSGAAPVLPPGWTQEVSRSTGETYYRHVESGKTQWEVPTPADVKLPAGWEAVDSADTGQTYYVNSLTGEHQFDRPSAPAGAAVEDELDASLQGTERTAARCDIVTKRLEQMQNHQDLLDGAPVFMAAAEGSSEAIGAVCAADPSCVTAQHPLNKATALHVAALHGHTQCVDELLSWGAEPCSGDSTAQTALHYAANQEEVLYALLSSGTARFAVNIEAEPSRATPLLYAAYYGNIGAISCLIDYGADIDGADAEGTTALHIAAFNGQRKAVKLLVKYGASLKLRDSQGRTPVEVAEVAGHEKVVKSLHREERKAAEANGTMATVEEGEEEEEPDEAEAAAAEDLGDDAWVEHTPLQDDIDEHVQSSQVSSTTLFQVHALYDYAGEPGDLTFFAGQIIHVHSTDDPGGGWWTGMMQAENEKIIGIFPDSFVEAVADGAGGDDAGGNAAAATARLSLMGGTSRLSAQDSEVQALLEEKERQIVAAQSKIAEWESRAKTAERELETRRAATGQQPSPESSANSEQLQELRTQLEQSRSTMQDERTRKAAEIAKLQEQLQESRKQQAADEGLSSEAASLAQQRADELAASQQKVASLEEKIGALQMEISRGREERNSGAATAGQLQKKLEGANAELASCREEADRQRKETIEAAKARASLEAQLKQKEEKVDALTQAVSKAEAMAIAEEGRMKNLDLQYKKEWALRKKYYNELQDIKGNIRVYSRARPLLKFEVDRGDTEIVDTPDDTSVRVRTAAKSLEGRGGVSYKTFSYNASFNPEHSQDDVFAEAKDLVQSTIDGYNVCIFAYGQTGSGKTFTMYGTKEQPGIAPRTVSEIWDLIERDRAERGFEFSVKVYMAELYLDGLSDLLRDKDESDKGPKLFVRKDSKGMVFIQNITEVSVNSATETMYTLRQGSKRRHVTGTSMNAESSRSHMIFSIVIDTKNPQSGKESRGKISLVDMAGSERVKRSEVTGQGFKEAVAINKSLSALLDVIDALSKSEGKGDTAVPYRNHILTQLMSDSLGGNAKTLMFVNISPASSNEEETLGSLGYATRASLIKNEVKKHEDSAEVQRLKKIVRLFAAPAHTTRCTLNNVAAGCRSRGCHRSRAIARGLPAAPHLRRRADGCVEAEDAD